MRTIKKYGATLEELLEEITVLFPENWGDESNDFSWWYAVTNKDGIIAIFANQDDAFNFRLSYINRILN